MAYSAHNKTMKQLLHLSIYGLCLCLLAIFTVGHTSTVTLVTDMLGIVSLLVAVWWAQFNTNKVASVLALCGISTLSHLPIGLWIIGLFVNDYNDTSLLAANILYYTTASMLTLVMWYYAIAMYRTPGFLQLAPTMANVRTYILSFISLGVVVAVVVSIKFLRVSALIF